VFELDAQQQWIKEHLPLAASEKLGQNLHQAQSLHKKHRTLEAEIVGHQPMIDRTLASGQALIGQSHPETKQVWTNILLTWERWTELLDTLLTDDHIYCTRLNEN
jgi:spectrin beta